jgi:hypothetical protein
MYLAERQTKLRAEKAGRGTSPALSQDPAQGDQDGNEQQQDQNPTGPNRRGQCPCDIKRDRGSQGGAKSRRYFHFIWITPALDMRLPDKML